MSEVTNLKPLPPALPATREDFLQHRKITRDRTLNDMVEEMHLLIIDDENYQRLLWAVYDEQAVEGSLSTDNVKAAELIRDKARAMGSLVQHEKLYTIVKCLGHVLRRYGLSRPERRNMVAGKRVPDQE